MIKKIIFYILGIHFCSLSLMFCIIYLNLLKMGFTFFEYLKYIITKFECLLFFVGIFFIILSFKKYENNNLINVNNIFRRNV